MDNEIAVRTVNLPADAKPEVRDLAYRMEILGDVLRFLLRSGQDFGKVPGGGDKLVLLKPGAEKLCAAFSFRPEAVEEIIELGGGHREYRFTVKMRDKNGDYLGFGVGSCSTMEKKYRYRNERIETGVPVPKEYWDLKNAGDPVAAQELIGAGFSPMKTGSGWMIAKKEKGENPDIADVWNTARKMAKKRALVDAVLQVTAASDIFTQDVEEADDDERPNRNQRSQQQQAAPKVDENHAMLVDTTLKAMSRRIEETKTIEELKTITKTWDDWCKKHNVGDDKVMIGLEMIDHRTSQLEAPNG